MDVSIIICTANRASELRCTLESLALVRPPGRAELLVVDNRSTDDTRRVIETAARGFPFLVRYLFEGEQGKYGALNTGIRASSGRVIVATDDDARFEANWLERAVDGLTAHGCDFVGGPVRPLWSARKPDWLDEDSSLYQKVIAVLDYGPEAREFGRGVAWPLGVNVAYRRDVFDQVGLFEKRLGRKLGTLRNQAQREWHLRARAAGVRGVYVPEMVVHHVIPPERLRKAYFRRWLYWNGISRAILYREGRYDIEEPDAEQPPNAGAPQLFGVPYPLIAKAARTLRSLVWHRMNGRKGVGFERELWLCSFAGVVCQRWADRHLPVTEDPATAKRALDRSACTLP
jgi:glucosyl-dolichyl phosphate glucuronosyltransferase